VLFLIAGEFLELLLFSHDLIRERWFRWEWELSRRRRGRMNRRGLNQGYLSGLIRRIRWCHTVFGRIAGTGWLRWVPGTVTVARWRIGWWIPPVLRPVIARSVVLRRWRVPALRRWRCRSLPACCFFGGRGLRRNRCFRWFLHFRRWWGSRRTRLRYRCGRSRPSFLRRRCRRIYLPARGLRRAPLAALIAEEVRLILPAPPGAALLFVLLFIHHALPDTQSSLQ
jgi:hypothetical protein